VFAGIGTQAFASTNFRVQEEPPIPEVLIVRVADCLRVLGQPVRLRLIEQLTAGPSTPQELSEVTGTSQQNVSKHLLVMYRAGLVTRRPQGSNVYYSLTDGAAPTVLHEMLASVKRQLRELSDLATQPPEES
jgi:DNA-binding transcriptional ArsR family regulator